MDWSTPGFPVLRYLLEFAQTHVYWVDFKGNCGHFMFISKSLATSETGWNKHCGPSLFQVLFTSLILCKPNEKLWKEHILHQFNRWGIQGLPILNYLLKASQSASGRAEMRPEHLILSPLPFPPQCTSPRRVERPGLSLHSFFFSGHEL